MQKLMEFHLLRLIQGVFQTFALKWQKYTLKAFAHRSIAFARQVFESAVGGKYSHQDLMLKSVSHEKLRSAVLKANQSSTCVPGNSNAIDDQKLIKLLVKWFQQDKMFQAL